MPRKNRRKKYKTRKTPKAKTTTKRISQIAQFRKELKFHGAQNVVVTGLPFGRGYSVAWVTTGFELAFLKRKPQGKLGYYVTIGNLTVYVDSLAEAAEVVTDEVRRK